MAEHDARKRGVTDVSPTTACNSLERFASIRWDTAKGDMDVAVCLEMGSSKESKTPAEVLGDDFAVMLLRGWAAAVNEAATEAPAVHAVLPRLEPKDIRAVLVDAGANHKHLYFLVSAASMARLMPSDAGTEPDTRTREGKYVPPGVRSRVARAAATCHIATAPPTNDCLLVIPAEECSSFGSAPSALLNAPRGTVAATRLPVGGEFDLVGSLPVAVLDAPDSRISLLDTMDVRDAVTDLAGDPTGQRVSGDGIVWSPVRYGDAGTVSSTITHPPATSAGAGSESLELRPHLRPLLTSVSTRAQFVKAVDDAAAAFAAAPPAP